MIKKGVNFKDKIFLLNADIINIYKEYCNEYNFDFNNNKAKEFINFLSIDIYDWIKGNLRYFE